MSLGNPLPAGWDGLLPAGLVARKCKVCGLMYAIEEADKSPYCNFCLSEIIDKAVMYELGIGLTADEMDVRDNHIAEAAREVCDEAPSASGPTQSEQS